MRFFIPVSIAALAFLLSACSMTGDRQYETCIVGISTLGGTAGAVVSGGSGAVPGVAAGAAASALLCKNPEPADRDGDGVSDDRDACPGTAAGAAVDSRGCALDSDGDGVPDHRDACPGSASGVSVDSRGCALPSDNLDEDGDGVADGGDRCPGTPAGVQVDRLGCPVAEEVMLSIDRLQFAFDSAQLNADARRALDAALSVIRSHASVKLDVVGHTDATGPDDYNLRLSQRRAQAAVDYLVGRGIDREQLRAVGRGESDPIASNDSEDGRERNRRVDLVVR